eukprot:scaffold36188_cov78-Cyclotella_meneghiniana.AAC.3
MPAGGVFQTEPPGGCLRQAFVRIVLSIAHSGRGNARLSDAAIYCWEHADWIPGLGRGNIADCIPIYGFSVSPLHHLDFAYNSHNDPVEHSALCKKCTDVM